MTRVKVVVEPRRGGAQFDTPKEVCGLIAARLQALLSGIAIPEESAIFTIDRTSDREEGVTRSGLCAAEKHFVEVSIMGYRGRFCLPRACNLHTTIEERLKGAFVPQRFSHVQPGRVVA